MAIQAVGFDLDGTLVRLDGEFLFAYMELVNSTVGMDFGHPRLSDALLASTAVMCASDGSNGRLADVFFGDFCQRAAVERSVAEQRFARFYASEFPQLGRFAQPVPGIHGLLATVRGHGLKIALLTNPVFPAEAVRERLRWAGLEDVPFDWQASLETAACAKPQPGFYLDAARALGIPPDQWLMVGNDLNDDIHPALRAGMHTYWVCESQAGYAQRPAGSGAGSLHRVLTYLRTLT
ncbi:MAG: HAD family hydrolase [Thermaerobacter sp.]|nr:HAD family hydrolase [Thermaerobacter sp.]